MNKKQVKVVAIFLELFLIISLFLPAGRIIESSAKGDTSLSVFGMVARYGGMGFADDALFYMILACAFPAASILSLLFVKERKNFGAAVVLNALYAAASACFFSSAAQKLVNYSELNLVPYVIVFISLAAMMLLIFGFLMAQPDGNGDSPKE